MSVGNDTILFFKDVSVTLREKVWFLLLLSLSFFPQYLLFNEARGGTFYGSDDTVDFISQTHCEPKIVYEQAGHSLQMALSRLTATIKLL